MDILDNLEWLGLKFDSGPKLEDVKNDILDNRFFQSQRQAIYNKYIEQLLHRGYARAVDGAILFTPNFEQPHGNFEFEDAVLGRIKTDQKMLKDGFIIRKADGMPTFHMAVVVDDYLMGITHVIRGQDHVPNTPKHILLQRALGFATPIYAHLPLILDEHGAKLSKRREDQKVLIKDFRADGFLPEVLVSYLGSLGWSPEGRKDDDQILSPDEILKRFDLSGVSASNSRFDMKKLQSLNAANLLRMRAEDLVARMEPFISRGYSVDSMVAAMPVVQPRLKTLADSRVFESLFGIRPDISRINVDQAARDILSSVRAMVDLIDIWTKEEILFTLKNCATRHGVKLGEVAQPIRLALTGQKCSPPIDDVIVLLGKEETKHRIDNALLAGVK
jgi:glutamyl-tRNA synthetase